jgi:hypothetical protein
MILRIDKKDLRVFQTLNFLLAKHQIDRETLRIGKLEKKASTWSIPDALDSACTGKFFRSTIPPR